MDEHIGTDAVSKDAADFAKIILQMMVLIALRTRQRGHREAIARAELARVHDREAREQQIREARIAKGRDPRNADLARQVKEGVARHELNPYWTRQMAVSLEKPAPAPMRWDSVERREHLREHLSRVVSPELAQVRMLHDIGLGKPGAAAVDRKPEADERRRQQAREMDARAQERARW